MIAVGGREPAWSGPLTAPLAGRVPARWRREVVVVIKAIHTAIFFSIASLIALVAWDGVRGRPRRRSAMAAAVALAESAVFVSNNQVCPLSPLAEELGAASGSVTDIFLPDWLSRRIPLVSGSVLVLGLVLHLRAWLARRGSAVAPIPGWRPGVDPRRWHARALPARAARRRDCASRGRPHGRAQ